MVKLVIITGGVIEAAGTDDVSSGVLEVNGLGPLSSMDASFSFNVVSSPLAPGGGGSEDGTSIAPRLNGYRSFSKNSAK